MGNLNVSTETDVPDVIEKYGFNMTADLVLFLTKHYVNDDKDELSLVISNSSPIFTNLYTKKR